MDRQLAVLVIGSTAAEVSQIGQWIEEAGYGAILADDHRGALRELYAYHPHAVVLLMDVMETSAWSIVQRIRELSYIPIILIASRATRSSLKRAFNLGLDGYLVKPLEPRELTGRLAAALHKAGNGNNNHSSVFSYEDLSIDWRKMETRVDGRVVHLSPTEFRLLALLVERRGWIVPYDEILTKVWGPGYEGDRNHVKLYIWYLRRKLEADPTNPRRILTKYGVGYTFSVDGAPSSSTTPQRATRRANPPELA